MIVISDDIIKDLISNDGIIQMNFSKWDDGEVYNLLTLTKKNHDTVSATILISSSENQFSDVQNFGHDDDEVRLIISNTSPNSYEKRPSYEINGFIKVESQWSKTQVIEIPVKDEIFSRFGGLLETDAISTKRVLTIGLGSVGSFIAVEMAKAGVENIAVMDGDRIEVGNVSRHAAGISHVGRYKTKVIKDLILEKNPYANVRRYEEFANGENIKTVRKLIKWADIVICVPDVVPDKLTINRICVEEGKPCIFAGAFRRACAGQILFMRPHESLCYQCLLMNLPKQKDDQEISNRRIAQELAYTDREVAIEPGLSIDIAPISLMVVKLAIQELLKNTETTLRSLDDDLVAPLYLWINRREVGTDYENLKPLEFNINGMHVLRWYGVAIGRHPGCPVCGDFEKYYLDQVNGNPD